MNQNLILHLLTLTTLISHGLSQSNSEKTRKSAPKSERLYKLKKLCSPVTVDLNWDLIKNVIPTSGSKDNPPGIESLSNSRSYDGTIPIKRCDSDSEYSLCPRTRKKCATRSFESRSTGLAVMNGSERLFVSLDYLEAKECKCTTNHSSATELFPLLTRADIAIPCSNYQDAAVFSEKGSNVSFSFHHSSSVPNDVPKSVMILRAFGQSQPLVVNILKRITNTPQYEDVDDWRLRASVSFDNNHVELHLQNVTEDDEGTYFCRVEFINSTSCFSSGKLQLISTPSETPKKDCKPRLISLNWSDMTRNSSNDTNIGPFIFTLQKCSNKDLMKVSNRECRPHSISQRKVIKCVQDTDGNEKEAIFHIQEDHSCMLKLKNVFSSDLEILTPSVQLSSLERSTSCNDTPESSTTRSCWPELMKVTWPDIHREIRSPGILRQIRNVNANITFHINKCMSDLTPCQPDNHHCISATTRKKTLAVCIPNDKAGQGVKTKIEYLEDETCSCGPRKQVESHANAELQLLNITKVKHLGKCSDKCTPVDTQISWQDLREHLNQWTYLSLHPAITAQNIKVKRCHQNLSPCGQEGFCDVTKEKISRKTLKLKNVDMKLQIRFYEASECTCKEKQNLSYNLTENKLNRPPIITYVRAANRRKKKNGN